VALALNKNELLRIWLNTALLPMFVRSSVREHAIVFIVDA
jgi:hypothetical protein